MMQVNVMLLIIGQTIRINKRIASKSFEYKTKSIGNTPDDTNILVTEVVVPLKYLSHFWRYLDLHRLNGILLSYY